MFGQACWSLDKVVAIQTALNQCRLVFEEDSRQNKLLDWWENKILDWRQNKPWDWRETIEKRESDVGLLLGFVYVTIISITGQRNQNTRALDKRER